MSIEKKKIILEDLAVNQLNLNKTVENLAQEMRKGFIETKNAIEELAAATKNGFDGVDEKFKKVDEQFKKVDEQFNEVNEKLDDLDRSNSQAHENTSLRLNEVAYKFEMVDLKKRVEVLEQKAKVQV